MAHCFPPFTNCFNIPTCFSPCLPSYYRSDTISGVSKLANFAHYGGCNSANDSQTNNCFKQDAIRRRNMGESRCDKTRKCPPLPPCQPQCIPNCKDLPAQRLRNVDILEELCYYTPGGDNNGAMDCYTVDCCGNVEKIEDNCCCEDENSGDGLQPVKYSRRQRFSFNDKNPDKPCRSDPWPFNECEDHCAGKGGNPKSKCGGNGHSNNGEASCGGRKYTYCPQETIDCSQMLPPKSGVYYWDRDRRAFVPEENLPKATEPIEKQVMDPEVEEYELLAEDKQQPACPPPPSIQPVIQPIILPTGGSNCPNPPPPCGPCSMPPCPSYPPPNCYPPPQPQPCNPPPCNPCNPCNAPCNPCNPCKAPCNSYNYCNAPCNPCNRPCNPCNPCNRPCNPCNSCNMPPACNPCNSYNPCNPCGPCNPCNPSCNPCMPCGPMNPFMNMCGGVLPMVIPMCPQQPGGMGGMPPPPPPPFPFPHNFNMPKDKKKKKKKKSESSKSESSPTEYTTTYSHSPSYSTYPTEYETYTTSYTDNIVVPGAPEAVLKDMGQDIPKNAYPVEMGNEVDVNLNPQPEGRRNSEPPPEGRRKSEPPPEGRRKSEPPGDGLKL